MKISRLLGIVTYLLNREMVTCKELSEKFEVSERTIQRDMDYINMSGVPVVSLRGSQGGYAIVDTFRLKKQTIGSDDLASIERALRSIASSIKDKDSEATLEKIRSINCENLKSDYDVDFDIIGENKEIQYCLTVFRKAIHDDVSTRFSYINSFGEISVKEVEPLSLCFKWYSWYLIGYDTSKKAYRIYKLSRISELVTHKANTIKHDKNLYTFESLTENDTRRCIEVQFECSSKVLPYIKEYLPNYKIIEKKTDLYTLEISVFEEEFHWFGVLLGLGKEVKIIKPTEIVTKIKNHIQLLQKNYDSEV